MKKILGVLLSLVLVMVQIPIAFAQTADVLYVLDASQTAVTAGATFSVDVVISNPNGQDVTTAGIAMTYDPAVLVVVDQDKDTDGVQGVAGDELEMIVEHDIDETAGTVLFATGTNGDALTSANFTLLTLYFQVKEDVDPATVTSTIIGFTDGIDTTIIHSDGSTDILDSANLEDLEILLTNVSIEADIDTTSVNPGDTVTVIYKLSNPDETDIIAIDMRWQYDENVLVAAAAKVDVADADPQFELGNDTADGNKVVLLSSGSPADEALDGTEIILGTATFTVAADAPDGETELFFLTKQTQAFAADEVDTNILGGFNSILLQVGDTTDVDLEVVATPEGGVFSDTQDVRLTASTEATIYYTTDGTEPDSDSDEYDGSLTVTESTTLKFFAKDVDDTETDVYTEIYTIGSGQYELTLVVDTVNVDADEPIILTVYVTDTSIDEPAPGLKVIYESSGGGQFKVPTSSVTDIQGKMEITYVPEKSTTIKASLEDFPDIADSIDLNVDSNDISLIILTDSLTPGQSNTIEVSVLDGNGDPVAQPTNVTLSLRTSDGDPITGESSTESGIASFTLSDIAAGKVYTAVAQANDIQSDPVIYSTKGQEVVPTTPAPVVTQPTNGLRPGGGSVTATGPAENIMVLLFILSGIGVWLWQERRA